MDNVTNKKTIPELSMDADLLCKRLSAAQVGELITYSEMDEIVGYDIRKRRNILYTAMRRLQKNEHKLFECVRSVGLKRLNDEQVVNTAAQSRAKIRRTAGNAVKKMACVQSFDDLPEDKKVEHNAAVSLFGAINAIAKEPKFKRLRDAVKAARQKLPLGNTLSIFTD